MKPVEAKHTANTRHNVNMVSRVARVVVEAAATATHTHSQVSQMLHVIECPRLDGLNLVVVQTPASKTSVVRKQHTQTFVRGLVGCQGYVQGDESRQAIKGAPGHVLDVVGVEHAERTNSQRVCEAKIGDTIL